MKGYGVSFPIGFILLVIWLVAYCVSIDFFAWWIVPAIPTGFVLSCWIGYRIDFK